MNETVLYFAFGSNLHAPQMHTRCPGCEVLQPAVLADYRLAFCGFSQRWEGGTATIVPQPGALVHGLLYRLTPAHVDALNGYESFPTVYGHLPVRVTARDGARLDALTYAKHEVDPRPPSLRYFHQIWRGYRAHGLDDDLLHAAIEHALTGAPGGNGGPPGTPR